MTKATKLCLLYIITQTEYAWYWYNREYCSLYTDTYVHVCTCIYNYFNPVCIDLINVFILHVSAHNTEYLISREAINFRCNHIAFSHSAAFRTKQNPPASIHEVIAQITCNTRYNRTNSGHLVLIEVNICSCECTAV